MCDDDSLDDMVQQQQERVAYSRRQFGALTVGAGLISILPAAACTPETKTPSVIPASSSAPTMVEFEVTIKTPDGDCDAYFVHPATGAYPGVLIWPDLMGLRDTFRQMGKRLAESGYSVIVVNPFYRTKRAPTAPDHVDMKDPATRQALMALKDTLTAETAFTDAKALISWLDEQPSVDRKRKMATTGYCMGGALVFRTAAAMSDRVGAGATFHGGELVTEKPESPHLLIPKMKGHYLIAIASNDDARQPDAKNVLKDSFAKASVPAEIEVYAGAMHGWCPPDGAAYNHDAAEKAWARLIVFLKTALS